MPKLAPVSRRKFVQRLRELGFEGPYAGGKHPQMKRGNLTLIIPNEHEGEIGPGSCNGCCDRPGFPAKNGWAADA